MKTGIIFLCAAALLQGCASLGVAVSGRSDAGGSSNGRTHLHERLPVSDSPAPTIAVRPDGSHAVVMPPCGNTSVVVNPDGTHSIAIISGSTATIVTP